MFEYLLEQYIQVNTSLRERWLGKSLSAYQKLSSRDKSMLDLVKFAMENGKRISITYEKIDGMVKHRSLEPYSLRIRNIQGKPEVVLFCHHPAEGHQTIEMYRVKKIKTVEISRIKSELRWPVEWAA